MAVSSRWTWKYCNMQYRTDVPRHIHISLQHFEDGTALVTHLNLHSNHPFTQPVATFHGPLEEARRLAESWAP